MSLMRRSAGRGRSSPASIGEGEAGPEAMMRGGPSALMLRWGRSLDRASFVEPFKPSSSARLEEEVSLGEGVVVSRMDRRWGSRPIGLAAFSSPETCSFLENRVFCCSTTLPWRTGRSARTSASSVTGEKAPPSN